MKATRLVDVPDEGTKRYLSGIKGFDKFTGGGIVPGSTILFAGEPGVGKSTFLLQLSNKFAEQGHKVLYASGEENLAQTKERANRLGTLHPEIWCSENLNLEELFDVIRELDPSIIVVDSIQLLYSGGSKTQAGSPVQIKNCLLALIEFAKRSGKCLITVGHATKQGKVAGLITLQHMVDVVFYMRNLESDLRALKSTKNRFGPSNLEWVVKMTQDGIEEAERVEFKKLGFEQISDILSRHPVNRYIVNSDMRWLFEQAFEDTDLQKLDKYDIIYQVREDE